MMDINKEQLQLFTSFLIKSPVEVVLLPSELINSQMKFTGRLLESLGEEKFIHLLETIFGAFIWLICNH